MLNEMIMKMTKKSSDYELAANKDYGPSHLPEIIELGKKMRFTDILEGDSNWRKIHTESGAAFIRDILKIPEKVHVSDNYSSPGTQFPRHAHPHKECFMVYTGRLELTLNGHPDVIVLEAPAVFDFDSDEGHSAFFPVETCYVATLFGGEFGF